MAVTREEIVEALKEMPALELSELVRNSKKYSAYLLLLL